MDAILHDPPRFGIAGELYSQGFYYEQLARILKRRGRLFHYTGSPNQVDQRAEMFPRRWPVGYGSAGFKYSIRLGMGMLGVKQ